METTNHGNVGLVIPQCEIGDLAMCTYFGNLGKW